MTLLQGAHSTYDIASADGKTKTAEEVEREAEEQVVNKGGSVQTWERAVEVWRGEVLGKEGRGLGLSLAGI